MYDYLKELGWEDKGRTGAERSWHEFTITSKWGMPFKWRVDLQYAANGVWVDVFYYPKQRLKGSEERLESLRFSGVIFSNEEIPVLMKQLQITI